MREGRTYLDYLEDILDAITKARQFVSGMSFEEFASDDKTAYEAAKKVPADIRSRQLDIPWREIAGMRDKLTHDYFGVNLSVVWKAVLEDLAPLESGVRSLLEKSK